MIISIPLADTLRRSRRSFPLAAALALLVTGPGAARAVDSTFDFEVETPTYDPNVDAGRPGALTSLVITDGTLSVTITRSSGTPFDLVLNELGQDGKTDFGLVSLDPFFDATVADLFVFEFSLPVSSVTLAFGDYGDDDDAISVIAYDGPAGSGSSIDAQGDSLPGGGGLDFSSVDVGVSGTGILSVTTEAGSLDFPNSLFLDNLRVTYQIPEPAQAGWAAAGVALALAALRRRAGRA